MCGVSVYGSCTILYDDMIRAMCVLSPQCQRCWAQTVVWMRMHRQPCLACLASAVQGAMDSATVFSPHHI